MKNQHPLVTVNILSHNRKEELRVTLQKVFEQDYTNIEVIVVDNASIDGAPEMVSIEFPEVRLIRLNKNIGIAGWNEGFKDAKGEYVLVLDDDSYPIDKTIINGVYQFFEKRDLGITSYNIYNLRTGKSQTEDFNEKPYLFAGGGALIKKQLIEKIGYFNELYFIYLHELDYSLRCYDNNFDILYLKDSTVIHMQSMKSRGKKEQNPFTSEYWYYNYFISHSIFIVQNFYFVFSLMFFLKYILNRIIICIRYFYIKSFFKALYKFLSMIPKVISGRKVASLKVQKFYHYGNMALIDRFFFPNFKRPF